METGRQDDHSSSGNNSSSNSSSNSNGNHVRLFLVHAGLDLPKPRITLLSARAAEKGATILTQFFRPPAVPSRKRKKRSWWQSSAEQKQQQHQQQSAKESSHLEGSSRSTTTPHLPTHIVIGEDCSAQQIAQKLQFSSVDEFERFVRAHGIKCAVPVWITHAEGQLSEDLKLHERWWKIDLGPNKKRNQDAEKEKSTTANNINNRSKLRQQPLQEDEDDDGDIAPNNDGLADAMKELGKLHQKCPLNDDDTWKAYAMDKIAGKIRRLPFQVTLERESQLRLKSIHGLGTSTLEKINQYLQTGYIERTKEFKRDPERMAMKQMMGIWGVGRKTASTLVKQGYKTIDDVRKALKDNKLTFERNQWIGVQCYEDFLEQMTRLEVERIGKVLKDAVLEEFPGQEHKVEITIMGSYRRGAPACGDVDVLITHQDYVNAVPPQMLGEVVEKLLDAGSMAFHLTLISGMKVRKKDEFNEGGFNDCVAVPCKEKADKYSGSSYMGVFNSPAVAGKRRRVDIKFYPYRARAFCWLYFTGNGFFNRSMRLWATRKHGLKLNDHGLYTREGEQSVLEVSEEREVFSYLGLEWKEPHERDCFDAVVGDDDPDKISATERNEERDHQWIE